jgi:hypothetical protein
LLRARHDREKRDNFQTSGGHPKCGIEYVLATATELIFLARLLQSPKSLSWIESKGQIGMLSIVNGLDYPGPSRLNTTPRMFNIPQAFLEVDGKDEPTYYLPESAMLFVAINTSNKINLSFSREPNGLDVTLHARAGRNQSKRSRGI